VAGAVPSKLSKKASAVGESGGVYATLTGAARFASFVARERPPNSIEAQTASCCSRRSGYRHSGGGGGI
jgi:hypothetical protein